MIFERTPIYSLSTPYSSYPKNLPSPIRFRSRPSAGPGVVQHFYVVPVPGALGGSKKWIHPKGLYNLPRSSIRVKNWGLYTIYSVLYHNRYYSIQYYSIRVKKGGSSRWFLPRRSVRSLRLLGRKTTLN